MIGRIFSIEEFSIFDGPGIRTTVFFKGCPLRCNWCHSPESQNYQRESVRSLNGCIHCMKCFKVCPYNRTYCDGCGKCTDVCPNNLIRMSGIDYEVTELYKLLSKNFDVLNLNNGGITFSGGEPLMQGEFLYELITLLKNKTHLAIQTCGHTSPTTFKKVIDLIDLVLFDFKIMDRDMAIKYEGTDNELIFKNFNQLKASSTPFIARIPLIPRLTDTKTNIETIINMIKDCHNLIKVELLPYNKMAGSKYAMIGKKYTPLFEESALLDYHLELFKDNNIEVSIL